MPSLTQKIPHTSGQARFLLQEIKSRVKASSKRLQEYEDKWRQAEEKVLAYLPLREVDERRKTSRENGLPQYTTIQIPYTYAVLMAAHTYFSSVFMGRTPVLQFTGRHGESSQSVQAVEALHDYQTVVGEHLGPLYTWLYDAGKYGVGIIGTFWDIRDEMISEIKNVPKLDPILGQEVVDPFTGQPEMEKIKTTRRVPGYRGNRLYNLQPWDFIFDVRFPIREFQRGEYCGMRRTLGWNEIKRREYQGYYMNTEHLTKSNYTRGSESSQSGSDQLNRPESQEDWRVDAEAEGFQRGHPMTVSVYEMYVEIIPKEFSLGESTYPEKWVFTCTQDFSVLIGAQPHGALHAKYPFNVLALEPEGYGLIPRGFAQTLEPVQHTIDWLINSHFYNVRAALNNKFVVDPSRVVMKDVLNPLPGGVIRLKPEAYGSDTKLAMTQMPVADVTQNHLRDLQMMYAMGERTVGVNDQIMGMIAGGGRKTATEIRTSTSFGVNRLKTIAEFFSATGFSQMSQILVSNSQQYYDMTMKFKLAGDLVQSAGMNFIEVTPEAITGFYDFVPVDGALPIDRYAQVNLWRELMAQVRQMPEIALQYDFGRMFEWVAQLAGLKNITQFKVEIMPDPLLIQQAKLGNSIPLAGGRQQRPKGGGSSNSTSMNGIPGPKQVPGMGPAA